MAAQQQGHPTFPPRNTYGAPNRLPDRTTQNNPPPFAQSIQRRPEAGAQQQFAQSTYGPPPPAPPQHGRPPPATEKESNALNELSEEQREEINEAFSLFDLDRDRHLDHHEIRVAFRSLGFQVQKPEIVQILQNVGVRRPPNQQRGAQRQPIPPAISSHITQLLISQQDFAQVAAQKILARDPVEEVERAFALFDLDQKSYITFEDLKRVAKELNENTLDEEELQAMIDEFDLEGRGGVSKEAFLGICLSG